MSSQGSASNLNGADLQRSIAKWLINQGHDVAMEVKLGQRSAFHNVELRADIVVNGGTIIECKAFSGQPGTIWKKIVADILAYSKIEQSVYIVLGNLVPPSVAIALKDAAGMIAPHIAVVIEDDFYVAASEWTSEQY